MVLHSHCPWIRLFKKKTYDEFHWFDYWEVSDRAAVLSNKNIVWPRPRGWGVSWATGAAALAACQLINAADQTSFRMASTACKAPAFAAPASEFREGPGPGCLGLDAAPRLNPLTRASHEVPSCESVRSSDEV